VYGSEHPPARTSKRSEAVFMSFFGIPNGLGKVSGTIVGPPKWSNALR
uniref:Uncharacterized protein n=1 Tax=Caenorhabditis japonica TaxID=281687 RepID=A0A8R1DM60_CAEJA